MHQHIVSRHIHCKCVHVHYDNSHLKTANRGKTDTVVDVGQSFHRFIGRLIDAIQTLLYNIMNVTNFMLTFPFQMLKFPFQRKIPFGMLNRFPRLP